MIIQAKYWRVVNTVKYILEVIEDKCDACGDCVYACSLAKTGILDYSLSAIRIRTEGGIRVNVVVCRHCHPAPCAEVCEFNAIRIDESTGAVVLDRSLCTSCKACLAVCPFGAIIEASNGSLIKCDLCGGDPECVKACSKGALVFVKTPVGRHLVREKRVVKTLLDIVEKHKVKEV
ncbi:4Fe-4S dicluster domain-containing protein [Desulfurococcaceae archaeon MEX13E-LK6-19]|nr:4Fe-4S dicluster domain-containing protein [Desulfurococcaceae archaeon MEX13E-LK6-19]